MNSAGDLLAGESLPAPECPSAAETLLDQSTVRILHVGISISKYSSTLQDDIDDFL